MDELDLSAPCSQQSLAVNEPIFGSATADVRYWLLIEHRGRWPGDIVQCDLPDEARAWLSQLSKRHRRLRTQLIRRPSPASESDDDLLTVFVVKTDEPGAIRRIRIASHAELAGLSLDDWLATGEAPPGEPGPEALYLVCTHAARDRCCGKHGTALLAALAKQPLDGELWRSSHQGGHRFAATLLYLPRGLHYGRLGAEDAAELVRAHGRGELYDLRCYRGRTNWSRPVQTAEAWLRDELMSCRFGDVELLSYALHDVTGTKSDRWSARFRTNDGMLHTLTIEPRRTPAFRQSCAGDEVAPASYYYVVRHEAQIT